MQTMPLSDGGSRHRWLIWVSAITAVACLALAVAAEDRGFVVLGISGAGFFAVTVLLVHYGDAS